MTPGGICHDSDVVWLKSELGDEVVVPGNSVNQGNRERAGDGEGCG